MIQNKWHMPYLFFFCPTSLFLVVTAL